LKLPSNQVKLVCVAVVEDAERLTGLSGNFTITAPLPAAETKEVPLMFVAATRAKTLAPQSKL
jgi:hypothetical protein